jgi:hypothetical protein
MNQNMTQSAARQHSGESRLARFGRRIADVVAECNYAQRRISFLPDTRPRH